MPHHMARMSEACSGVVRKRDISWRISSTSACVASGYSSMAQGVSVVPRSVLGVREGEEGD